MKRILLLLYFLSSFIYAQSVGDFGSAGTGNWGATNANWKTWDGSGWNGTPAGAPTSSDNVYIRSGHTVTLDVSGKNCKNLIVQSSGKLYDNSSSVRYINVFGDVTCDGTIGNGSTLDGISFNIEGTSCTISGSGTFDALVIRKNASTNLTTTLTVARDVNLRNGGTAFYNNIGATFDLIINSGVTFSIVGDGTTAGSVSIDGIAGSGSNAAGGTITVNGTLTISGSYVTPGSLILTNNNTSRSCNLSIGTTGSVNIPSLSITSSGSAGSSLAISNGGVLNFTSSGFGSFTSTNFTYTFSSGSTVQYSASNDQTIGNPASYSNLTLSGSGTKTLSGATTIFKTLTIGSSTTLADGGYTLTENGNLSNSGTHSGAGKILLSGGSSLHTLSGTGTYQNLELSDALGATLSANTTIAGTLTLTSGNITTGAYTLTLGSSASSTGSLSRTSGTIIGNFERWFATGTNSSFVFPVGTSSNYRPVTISTSGVTTGGKILVSHTDGTDGTNLSSSVTDGSYTINKRSNMYWTLTGTTISGGTYDLSMDGSGQSGITDATKLRIIHSTDGSSFDVQGTHSDGSGTVVNRTGIAIGTFSRFYIGSNISDNPLPVELVSFSAFINNKTVNLRWRTATEMNNYGFEIERSDKAIGNSVKWEKIGFVNGNGNSNSPKNYSFTDEPYGGKEFKYRLKQIDFDGAFEYSDEVKVVLEDVNTFSLEQNYPNPFNPSTKISYTIAQKSDVKLRVYNVLAQLQAELVNEQQDVGHYQVLFNGSNLPSGTYFYKLEAGKFVEVKKFLLVK